jgi:hypothetical protein
MLQALSATPSATPGVVRKASWTRQRFNVAGRDVPGFGPGSAASASRSAPARRGLTAARINLRHLVCEPAVQLGWAAVPVWAAIFYSLLTCLASFRCRAFFRHAAERRGRRAEIRGGEDGRRDLVQIIVRIAFVAISWLMLWSCVMIFGTALA